MSVPFHVFIPARFASSRLPGKPLLPIGDRPMVAHALERARESGCVSAFVATDDARIADAVRAFGGEVLMTSADHVSGTDRLAEAVALAGLADDAIIVNLQGDEPFVPGELIRALAVALDREPVFGMATVATPIRGVDDLFNPNVVKVTLSGDVGALYFSRSPIPFVRGVFDGGTRPTALPERVTFLRHIGMYAYRAADLRRIASAPASELEQAESLEQLRAMALGIRIHVTVVSEPPVHGVDTPEDLARVQRQYAAGHSH